MKCQRTDALHRKRAAEETRLEDSRVDATVSIGDQRNIHPDHGTVETVSKAVGRDHRIGIIEAEHLSRRRPAALDHCHVHRHPARCTADMHHRIDAVGDGRDHIESLFGAGRALHQPLSGEESHQSRIVDRRVLQHLRNTTAGHTQFCRGDLASRHGTEECGADQAAERHSHVVNLVGEVRSSDSTGRWVTIEIPGRKGLGQHRQVTDRLHPDCSGTDETGKVEEVLAACLRNSIADGNSIFIDTCGKSGDIVLQIDAECSLFSYLLASDGTVARPVWIPLGGAMQRSVHRYHCKSLTAEKDGKGSGIEATTSDAVLKDHHRPGSIDVIGSHHQHRYLRFWPGHSCRVVSGRERCIGSV